MSIPLDLGLADDEIHLQTEVMVTAMSGYMPRAVWHERLSRCTAENGTVEHRA
jgi:hypothetical protein